VFIFDNEGTLRYHGSIDDSRDSTHIQQRPARDAIDALLAGTAIAVPTTKAFGCSIKRAR
jgi:hypothetical protein